MPDPNNSHDALFRRTFSRAEHASAVLRTALPAELLSHVDLSTLTLAPGSYVDAELTSSQSDLLFSVDIAGKSGFLYLLFEHQSSVDELMALRTLKYVLRVLDQHLSATGSGKRALPLPITIPVVLHHSATGWTAATRVEELFDPELAAHPSISPYLPRFGFVLDDISHLSDEQLGERALGLVPTLTLWALRDARDPARFAASLGHWASAIRALARAESGVEALLTIFRYLSLVVGELSPQTLRITLLSAAPETESMIMTTLAEHWKAEGRAESKAELMTLAEHWKAEGKAEGMRRVLRQLLELKFGALPETEAERIQVASEEQLSRWTARILTAASLADVLAG